MAGDSRLNLPPHDAANDASTSASAGMRSKLAVGVAGSLLYQPFSILIAAVGVLLTARLVPPHEFGLFVMANLVLQAIGALAATAVARHALFTRGSEAPRWNLYFLLLASGQTATCLICNISAALCGLSPTYRQLQPLLHVASIGFLLESFAELDRVMAQRSLDFPRVQLLTACAEVLRLVVVVAFALAGFGVWGLVIGNSVLISLPFVVDLLFIRRWRPKPAEWSSFTKAEILPPVKFALHYSGANSGNALRQAAESALIPIAFTPAQVGLVSRAAGLFTQTAGRVLQGFNETAVAALPSLSSEPDRFRRGATIYLKVMGGLMFAAVGFMAFAGPTLSAVLYGPKWKEVDPYILAAAIQVSAAFFAAVCSAILLMAGRQRANIVLLVSISIGAIPSLVALAGRFSPGTYLWTQAASSLVVASFGLLLCRPILGLKKAVGELLPALSAAGVASLACFGVEHLLRDASIWLRLPADVAAFAFVHVAVMRIVFPRWLGESLSIAPKGEVLRRWLSV